MSPNVRKRTFPSSHTTLKQRCLSAKTHQALTTSIQRWFNVKTLNQRWIDVISVLCDLWVRTCAPSEDSDHSSLGAFSITTEANVLHLGEAKVTCILRDRGVYLRLAYSWARPALLTAGKDFGGGGSGGCFISSVSSFSFISSFSPVPLIHLLCHLFHLFSLLFWGTTQNDPQVLTFR